MSLLKDGLEAGRAPVMWERVVIEALPKIQQLIPAGNHVLEVGYGDGLLICYLCRGLGWEMVGLDIDPKAQECANENAGKYGLVGHAHFICCEAAEVLDLRG